MDSMIVEVELAIERKALRDYFHKAGIKCLDCPAAEIETFRQGAHVHNIDFEAHLGALNDLARTNPFDPKSDAGYVSLPRRFGRWLLGRLQDKP